jgi:RimJ/RimL family protein N-acetyltransferase
MRRSRTAPRIVLPDRPLTAGETSLRGWRDADVPALVEACQDPDIVRWTRVPASYGEADARFYLRQRYDATFAGVTAPFAMVHTATQELLGSISLMRFNWRHARGEVGYWLAASARGQGHATRAVRLICGWGFDTLGLERIDLLAATGNPASQRVAERAGFTREAVLRSYMEGTYERQDMVAFGLLRDELAR